VGHPQRRAGRARQARQGLLEGEQRAKDTEDAYAKLEGSRRSPDAAATRAARRREVAQVRAMLRGEAGAPRGIEVKPSGRVDFRTLSKLTAGAGANTVKTSFYDQLIQNMIETSAVLQAGVRS
jgi:hypothetical protein